MGWNPLEDSWGFGTGGWSGLTSVLKDLYGTFILVRLGIHPKMLEEAFRLIGITGETIYSVQAINSKLIPDKQESFVKKIILKHALDNTNIVAQFQLFLSTGIHASTNRYLDYGRNYFINGVPTMSLAITGVDTGSVDSALETIEGEAVTVLTAVITFLPTVEWVKWYLQENENFTYYNSQLISGTNVYQYGSALDVGGSYDVTFNKISGPGVDPLIISGVPIEDITKAYILSTYALDSAITLEKIWIYDRDSGVFPALDPVVDDGTQTSSILPIVALRKNFVDLDHPSLQAEYDSSKITLKQLELSIDMLITSIRDNPDQGNIEDAFVIFSLNVYSESVAVIKAMREMFTYLEGVQTTNKNLFDAAEPTSNPTPNVLAITEQNYNQTIQFNYIDSVAVVGSIGIVGFANSSLTVLPNSPVQNSPDTDSDETFGGLSQSFIVLREQTSSTVYTETTIHGPVLFNAIATRPGEFKLNTILLEDVGGANRDNFAIPLILTAISDLPPVEQEEVLYAGLSMVIYAIDSQDLKYYETPQFFQFIQIVVIVVSVVLSILSGGSAVAILAELGKNLIYQYGLQLALKEILKHNLSDDERRAVLLLFTAASIIGPNIVSFDFNSLAFADQLLFSVDAVTKTLLVDTNIEAEELQNQIDVFTAQNDERQKVLQAAQDGFAGTGINPLFIRESFKADPYTSPTGYYDRSIHTGNPGVASLDQIGTFYDNALKLPELT